MKKVIVFLVILTTGSIFNSCESSTYGDISVVANPTYTANIGPIVHSTCAGCHYAGKQSPDLENFAQVKDAIENGDLLCVIDNPSVCFYSSIMPQSGRMPQTTIDMFKLWANQGYKN